MKETKNYKLKLPEQADNIDIDVLDENFTKLDAELAKTDKNASDHAGDKNNPHEVSKKQLGLDKVENKSSADIRSEITKKNVTDALGFTPPSTNTTYGAATQSAAGLMTAADKKKLDEMEAGAQAHKAPTKAEVMSALGATPAFTAPTAVTPDKGDNSQRLATTEFVTQAIDSLKALLGADYIGNVIKSVDIEIVRKVNWGHSESPYYTVTCTGCTLVSSGYINNPNGTSTRFGNGTWNVYFPFYIGIDRNKTVLTPVSAATLNSGILTVDTSIPSTYASVAINDTSYFTDYSNDHKDDYVEYAVHNTTITLR